MAQVHNEVMKEAAEKGTRVNEEELTKRIHNLLNSQSAGLTKLKKIENVEAIEITEDIKTLSKIKTLDEMVKNAKDSGIDLIAKTSTLSTGLGFFFGGGATNLFGGSTSSVSTSGFGAGTTSLFGGLVPLSSGLSFIEPSPPLKFGLGRGKRATKATATKINAIKYKSKT